MNLIENVRDNIPDPLIQWTQPPFSTGLLEDFPDPLIAQHTLINTTYLEANYSKLFPFKNKIKYEIYHQKGSQKKGKSDRKLLGIVNKMDYRIPITKSLSLWPKWKQMYKTIVPTDPQADKTEELSEIFFFLVRHQISRGMWVHVGAEYEIFNNLGKAPTPEDFKQLTLAAQLSNSADYMGYKVTANIGFRWNRSSFEEKKTTSSIAFVNLYAGSER